MADYSQNEAEGPDNFIYGPEVRMPGRGGILASGLYKVVGQTKIA